MRNFNSWEGRSDLKSNNLFYEKFQFLGEGGVLFIKVLKSEIWPTMWDVWWACGGKVQICDHFVLTQPVLCITEFPLLRLKSSFRHWIYFNRNSLLALLMPCKGCYAKTKLTSQLFFSEVFKKCIYVISSAFHFGHRSNLINAWKFRCAYLLMCQCHDVFGTWTAYLILGTKFFECRLTFNNLCWHSKFVHLYYLAFYFEPPA